MVPRQEATGMMAAAKRLLGATLLVVAGVAQAGIYRCQQANGEVSYQDTPCASGAQRKIDGPATARHEPPAAAVMPMPLTPPPVEDGRPAAADLELRRLVRDTVREEQGAARKPCPSEHDIRKIEVDISSIRNRDNDRLQTELRKQLRDAKACR
jgi:hypothetical protein